MVQSIGDVSDAHVVELGTRVRSGDVEAVNEVLQLLERAKKIESRARQKKEVKKRPRAAWSLKNVSIALGIVSTLALSGWYARGVQDQQTVNAAVARRDAAEKAKSAADIELARRPRVTITFRGLEMISQDVGGSSEKALANVHFILALDGQPVGQYRAEVRLPAGETWNDGDLFVGAPINYNMAFNQEAFEEAVSRYVRMLIGKDGHGFRVRNSQAIVRGETYSHHWTTSFRADTPAPRGR
jgi:hypothetical protein